MPYPFDANPLESHLAELRRLKEEERRLSLREDQAQSGTAEAAALDAHLRLVKAGIAAAYLRQPQARGFDVFETPLSLRLREFEEQNPRPTSPARTCAHASQERRVRTFRDGTIHACLQCLACGQKVADVPKPENWRELPRFGDALRDAASVPETAWQAERARIRYEIEGALDERFRFDDDGFSADYERSRPRPFDPTNCQHQTTSLCRRTYGNGTWAAVLQCDVCGKHLRSVRQADAPPPDTLKAFDETRGRLLHKAGTEWLMERVAAGKSARNEFNQEIARKLASGELVYTDTSLFGTYYSSPEWQRTRLRVLARDDHACQSCGDQATDAHHITYDRLGCENDLDLIALCRACHNLVHYHQSKGPHGWRLLPSEIRTVRELPLEAED
jgi:hypothetical protein